MTKAPEYSRSERSVPVKGSEIVDFNVPAVVSSGTAIASLRAAGLLIEIQRSWFCGFWAACPLANEASAKGAAEAIRRASVRRIRVSIRSEDRGFVRFVESEDSVELQVDAELAAGVLGRKRRERRGRKNRAQRGAVDEGQSARALDARVGDRPVLFDLEVDDRRDGASLRGFEPVHADRDEHPLDVVGELEVGVERGPRDADVPPGADRSTRASAGTPP